MFAEDGAFEILYLAQFGLASRYSGRAEISAFFKVVRELYPGFVFENVRVLMETPGQVFAEYELRATSSMTGRKIQHLIFGRLVAENGQIKIVREALNAVEIARAIYPQGVPELPEHATEK
jgi:uncharacterized protein